MLSICNFCVDLLRLCLWPRLRTLSISRRWWKGEPSGLASTFGDLATGCSTVSIALTIDLRFYAILNAIHVATAHSDYAVRI